MNYLKNRISSLNQYRNDFTLQPFFFQNFPDYWGSVDLGWILRLTMGPFDWKIHLKISLKIWWDLIEVEITKCSLAEHFAFSFLNAIILKLFQYMCVDLMCKSHQIIWLYVSFSLLLTNTWGDQLVQAHPGISYF